MKILDHTYSQNIQNKKIAIFGILPPPLGGVSIHIQRVTDLFLSRHNKVVFFPIEQWIRKLFFLYVVKACIWLFKTKPDLVYYHGTYLKKSEIELLFLVLIKKLLKYHLVLVDHDSRHLKGKTGIRAKLFSWITRNIDHIVCIGEATYHSYQDSHNVVSHLSVESAFISPPLHREAAIEATYPSSINIFMHDHTPVLLLSASHVMVIDQQDIYGIDKTIIMLASLKETFPDVGLIIGLAQVLNTSHFKTLQHMMREYDVAENIFILYGNKELWPLLKKIDIFLRPTVSDGDSISVREAIYFKVPVVASNICMRPKECYCYDNLQEQDYYIKVNEVISNKVYEKN